MPGGADLRLAGQRRLSVARPERTEPRFVAARRGPGRTRRAGARAHRCAITARAAPARSGAMRLAAVDAAAARQRLVARQMHAAMGAGHHRLRRPPPGRDGFAQRRTRAALRLSSQSSSTTAIRKSRHLHRVSCAAGAAAPRARSASRRRPAAAAPRRRRASAWLAAAPAEGAPAGEQGREDDPAEHREHRLVVPAPLRSRTDAQQHGRRQHDEAGLDEAEGQPLEVQQRHAPPAVAGAAVFSRMRRSARLEQHGMQHGGAEQAVGGDAEQPVQRRQRRFRLRCDSPGKRQRERRRPPRRASASPRRTRGQRHEAAFDWYTASTSHSVSDSTGAKPNRAPGMSEPMPPMSIASATPCASQPTIKRGARQRAAAAGQRRRE